MPNNNPQSQQPPAARANERVEQGAQRIEQGVQSAADAAIAQVRDARERAETGLEQQRGMVADRVRRFGDVLRHSSDQLTREDEFAQNLLDSASNRVQRVASYIERVRPEDVMDDLTTLARRQPGLFFGGAFLVGLAIGRFAKSSTERVEQREAYHRGERSYPVVTRNAASRTQNASQATTQATSQATSKAVGSAFGTDVHYGAQTANEPPKPQPHDASHQPRATEPGQGNKS